MQSRTSQPLGAPQASHLQATSARWLIAALAAIGIYFAVFYATPLAGLQQAGEPLTRGRLVLQSWLLADEFAGHWFGSPAEFAFADRLPVLAMAGTVLAVAVMLGMLVLDRLKLACTITRLEVFFFASAIGLNLVSLYVLAVGLLGGLRSRSLFLLPALAIAACWAARSLRRAPAAHHPSPATHHPPLTIHLLWLALPLALPYLFGGMLPPIEFDVREYHLQVPKEFFQAGRIGFLPHNVYGNMPLGAEMLSLLAMVLWGDWWMGGLAGKTLIALFVPLTAVGLLAFGRRFLSPSAAVLAALLYLSVPWLAQVSNLGLIDAALAFYLLAAVYAAWLWRETQQAPVERTGEPSYKEASKARGSAVGWLLVAGFLAGGAAGCKYPGVVFVMLPLAAWVFLARRRADLKTVGLFLLSAGLGGGLWYVKNALLAGNPTYPLLYGVFGGQAWSAEEHARWATAHRPDSFSLSAAFSSLAQVLWRSPWLSPLLVPLAALSWWTVAAALRASRPEAREGTSPGAAMPAAVPLLLWLWAFVGFALAMWWLFTHRIDRFWLPVMPLLALLAAAGATWSAHRHWKTALTILLVVGIAANLTLMVGPFGGYTRYFVSYERLRIDPERVDPWHLWLNDHVPEERAVLVVGDAQVYELSPPFFYRTVFNGCALETLMSDRSTEDFHRLLNERQIWCIYVHWGEIARYRSPGNYGYSDFTQPEVFHHLVEAGVLYPPHPPLGNHPGQVFRVVPR